MGRKETLGAVRQCKRALSGPACLPLQIHLTSLPIPVIAVVTGSREGSNQLHASSAYSSTRPRQLVPSLQPRSCSDFIHSMAEIRPVLTHVQPRVW